MSQAPAVRRFTLEQAHAGSGFAKSFEVYEAAPAEPPRGGVVVIQEIFGVNSHVRSVCQQYARAGYLAWAPAVFDHVEKGVELGYDQDGFMAGVELAGKVGLDIPLADVRLCAERFSELGLKTCVVGYCWGGSVAYLAAAKIGRSAFAAASCYYGSQVPKMKMDPARCPTVLHFGERDTYIDVADVKAFQAMRPETTVHLYPANHGFNCTDRADYDEASARLAFKRTLDLFNESVGWTGRAKA